MTEIPTMKSPQEDIFARWFADNGDRTLRVDYEELNENSVVLDVGGYEGQWTSDIFARYGCYVHVFEALPVFASAIARRFSKNSRIKVHSYGLGGRTRDELISICENSSSIFKDAREVAEVQIVRAAEVFQRESIAKIDLLKINIEGGEYELMEHLIDAGVVSNIRNVQIQFHDFIPLAEQRMAAIQHRLRETHELSWQYRFVWENWRRREPSGRVDSVRPIIYVGKIGTDPGHSTKTHLIALVSGWNTSTTIGGRAQNTDFANLIH